MRSSSGTVRPPGHDETIAPVTILDGQGHVVRVVPAAEFRRPESASTTRRRRLLRRLLIFVVFPLLLALPGASAAQTRSVRLEGRVQWIAGNVLSLSVNDRPGVGIDLVRVPQSDYGGLVQGDWVIVTGELSDDYRRVLGTSIQRSDLGVQAP